LLLPPGILGPAGAELQARSIHGRLDQTLSTAACHHSFGTSVCRAPWARRRKEVGPDGDGIHPHSDRGRQGAQVAKESVEITGVQQAEAVAGPFDVIVHAEARNIDELGKLVVARVQTVDGITRTLTCPVVHL
jgi:hypothetical protein